MGYGYLAWSDQWYVCSILFLGELLASLALHETFVTMMTPYHVSGCVLTFFLPNYRMHQTPHFRSCFAGNSIYLQGTIHSVLFKLDVLVSGVSLQRRSVINGYSRVVYDCMLQRGVYLELELSGCIKELAALHSTLYSYPTPYLRIIKG